MKVTVPDAIKKDLPDNNWGKVLGSTPVVMAVVATLLAGLASSEMTRAQYDRSFAAQLQSKAGDQWGYFQAKRLRSSLQRNSCELMLNLVATPPFSAAALKAQAAQWSPTGELEAVKQELLKNLESPVGQDALAALQKVDAPLEAPAQPQDPAIKAALGAMDSGKGDQHEVMAPLLAPISDAALDAALDTARQQTQAFDAAAKPVSQCLDRIASALQLLLQDGVGAGAAHGDATAALVRSFTRVRLTQVARRYDQEARFNQIIANLYELQIRRSNISAERHHQRSQRFFLGMLGAQLGVIIATFAMAARRRSLLWSLAAGAGGAAVGFAIYVYLCL